MSIYEICAIILVSGITAHIVGCYEIVRMEKMMEQFMDEHATKIQEIIRHRFL